MYEAFEKITLIAAIGESNQIGLRGKIPWHIPEDLRNFKKLTMGHHVLMGRKTFESIGHALPGRNIYVLTRDRHFTAKNVFVIETLISFIHMFPLREELFVAGGGKIYELMLPYAHRIYLSRVAYNGDADAYFPELNLAEWKQGSKVDHETNGQLPAWSFECLERINA